MADFRTIEKARKNPLGPGEDPEYAYRRGYCQGILIATEAVEDWLDPARNAKLSAFLYSVGDWWSAWRRNRTPQQQQEKRDHSAPKPDWMKEREEPLPAVPADDSVGLNENPKRSTSTPLPCTGSQYRAESVRDEIQPLAPYWLPQQQRGFLDRVLNSLIERKACSICGNAWKSNSLTAYGLDTQGHVVVAGTCCIAKIVELMGYGFFGRCDSPDDQRELMSEARDWKIEDWVWFNEHPARSHRARIPFSGEDLRAGTEPGYAPVILVRQIRPGMWERRGFDLDANMVPMPDDEALVHAMFEIAARREPAPTTMQAFLALRDKYATRDS
jgi:hypothetical protein